MHDVGVFLQDLQDLGVDPEDIFGLLIIIYPIPKILPGDLSDIQDVGFGRDRP